MAVSQPAVSRLISDLEYSLKFKLFERKKGRLVPTPEAVRFYQGVERFYIGLDELDHVAEQIRTQKPADLKICAMPALSTFVFPHAVRQFRSEYPNVALRLESCSSSEIVSRLQTHLTQLGLTLAFPEVPGIVQEQLLEAPHVCAVHESHRLARKEVLRPEDFEGEEVIDIMPSGLVNWNLTRNTLDKAGVKYSRHIGIQNSHTGYSLIAANLAIGLIEPFAAAAWLKNGVVVRPFEPKVMFRYVIAYSENQAEPAAMQAFVKYVREACGKISDLIGE